MAISKNSFCFIDLLLTSLFLLFSYKMMKLHSEVGEGGYIGKESVNTDVLNQIQPILNQLGIANKQKIAINDALIGSNFKITAEVEVTENTKVTKNKLELDLNNLGQANYQLQKNAEELQQAAVSNNINPTSIAFVKTIKDSNKFLAISIAENISINQKAINIEVQLILTDLYLSVFRFNDAVEANNLLLKADPTNSVALNKKAQFRRTDECGVDNEKILLDLLSIKQSESDFLAYEYTNLTRYYLKNNELTEAKKYASHIKKEIDKGDYSISMGEALAIEAEIAQKRKEYVQSEQLYLQAVCILEKESDIALLCRTKAKHAFLNYLTNNMRKSESLLHEGISFLEDEDVFTYLAIEKYIDYLYKLYKTQCRIDEFVSLLDYQLDIFRSKDDTRELVLEKGIRIFAYYYDQCNLPEKAEPLYLECIRLLDNAGVPSKQKYCVALANMGSFYRFHQVDSQKAEEYLRESLTAKIRYEGRFHSSTAQTRKSLAGLLTKKGKAYCSEARELYRDALRILIIDVGYEHERVAKWIHESAIVDTHMENFRLAEIKIKYALELYEKLGFIQTGINMMPIGPTPPIIKVGPMYELLMSQLNHVHWEEGILLFHDTGSYSDVEISAITDQSLEAIKSTLEYHRPK